MGHYNLGLIYLRRQDPSLALQSLKRAGEINSLHFGAHYQLGKLYRDAGLLDQALPCFLQAGRLLLTKRIFIATWGSAGKKRRLGSGPFRL